MSTVRLFNPESKTMTEIPAQELAADCVLVNVPEIGEVYVEARFLEPSKQVRHEVLPEDLRKRIRLLHAIFKNVCDSSLAKWEHDFKLDLHPEREVAVWERIAVVFKKYSKSKGPNHRHAVFEVALKCSATSRPEEVPMIVSAVVLKLLGRQTVEKMAAEYFEA